MVFLHYHISAMQCTEVHFASFLLTGFISAIMVNPSERKLAKTHPCELGEMNAVKLQAG